MRKAFIAGRRRRARSEHSAVVVPVCAALLLACSGDAGVEAPVGAESRTGEARYLIASRLTLPEGRRATYLTSVPSLDEGTLYDLDAAVETMDGWSFGRGGQPVFWHAGQREPTITRWTVHPDGRFEPGAVLSLANLGMNQTGQARNSVFVAPDRAYFVEETHPEEVIIWNPEAMTLMGTIPLGVDGLGPLLPRARLVQHGERLLVTVVWRDQDSAVWADHVRLIEVDPGTDRVIGSTEEARCGSIAPTGTTSDGFSYFSAESSAAPVRAMLGTGFGHPPCALRVAAGAATFDPSFSPDLESLTGGRPVGAVLMLDTGAALMDVWHADLVTAVAPDGSNWDEVRREAGFLRWRWDIAAMTAEPVAGAEPVAFGSLDQLRRFSVDGLQLMSVVSEDVGSNVTSELLPSGEARARFSGPGQLVGLVHLR